MEAGGEKAEGRRSNPAHHHPLALTPEDQRIRRQVKAIIEEMIHSTWLHKLGVAKAEIIPSKYSGGTSAVIFEANVQVRLVVKYHSHDVPNERNGYQLLKKGPDRVKMHLVVPVTLDRLVKRPVVWITPHARATPLHELVVRLTGRSTVPDWLAALYDDFLDTMSALWTQTKTAVGQKQAGQILRDIYVKRIYTRTTMIEEGLDQLGFDVPDLMALKIDVNGHTFDGKTFKDVFDDFEERLMAVKSTVSATCTAHYDEHANNILVTENQAHHTPDAWLLIDYVNSRLNADWVYSIAKMRYWWAFYCVIEQSKLNKELQNTLDGQIWVEDGTLKLTYQQEALRASVPPICLELDKRVMALAEAVAADFNEVGDDWRRRLDLAYFAVVYGAAALHFAEWPYAAPILLGEALEQFHRGKSLLP